MKQKLILILLLSLIIVDNTTAGLHNSICNNLNLRIYADIAPSNGYSNPNQFYAYEYTFVPTSGGSALAVIEWTPSIDSAFPIFSDVLAIDINETYTVTVKTRQNQNAPYIPFGASCQVAFNDDEPLHPNVCNNLNLRVYDLLVPFTGYSNPNAYSLYTYNFYSTSNTSNQPLFTHSWDPSDALNNEDFNSIMTTYLDINSTYFVTVTVTDVYGNTGEEGTPCQIGFNDNEILHPNVCDNLNLRVYDLLVPFTGYSQPNVYCLYTYNFYGTSDTNDPPLFTHSWDPSGALNNEDFNSIMTTYLDINSTYYVTITVTDINKHMGEEGTPCQIGFNNNETLHPNVCNVQITDDDYIVPLTGYTSDIEYSEYRFYFFQNGNHIADIVWNGTPPFLTFGQVPNLNKCETYQTIIQVSDINGNWSTGDNLYGPPCDIETECCQVPLQITTCKTETSNSNCDGSIMVNVNGMTPPYNFIWSNGDSSNSINNLCSGTYSVSITDDNGSFKVYQVIIN